MPNINIAVSDELLKAVNMAALEADLTQPEFIIAALTATAKGVLPNVGVQGKARRERRPEAKAVSGVPEVSSDAEREVRSEVKEVDSERSKPVGRSGKKLSADDYMKLSKSEQTRAQREGRF